MVMVAGERSKLSSNLKLSIATTLSLRGLIHGISVSTSLRATKGVLIIICNVFTRAAAYLTLLLWVDTAGCGSQRVVSDDAVFSRSIVFLGEYAYMPCAIVYYIAIMMAILVC